jgi:hypothetical protein
MLHASFARVVTLAALVAVAGCSDVAAPTSRLAPGNASLGLGDPPPPPVSGDAFLEFSIAPAIDGSDEESTTCSAAAATSVKFQYFLNTQRTNAFLHIRVDGQGLDASVHQTNNKLTAKGTLTGPGFTFAITNALSGDIIESEVNFPSAVNFQVTGKLTVGTTTCAANANVSVQLQGEEEEPN